MSLPTYDSTSTIIPPQPDYAGLQVTNDSEPEVRQPDNGKIFIGFQALKSSTTTEGASSIAAHQDSIVVGAGNHRKHRRRRYFLVVAALIIVIVVLAVVLSHVLSQRTSSNSTPDTHSNPNSTNPKLGPNDNPSPKSNNSSTPLQFISQGSHLSAAAWSWEANGGFTKFFLYQDPEGSIRYSLSSGGKSSDALSWGKPGTFQPTYTIANGTSITTTTLSMQKNAADGFNVQLEVFYLNQSSVINGMTYRSSVFGGDSISAQNLQALPGSSLAAYWPFILMQTVEGTLQLIKYDVTVQDVWVSDMLPERAMHGSEFAIVPLSRNYSEISDLGRYAIFYQSEEGQLTGLENPGNVSAPEGSDTLDVGWFSTFPEITLPDNGTFTAISVAGSTDKSETSVDTFVLYRDEKSIIQQLSRDGQSGAWSSSTPKAFTGADNDTKIACVPTLIWEEKPRWEDHWLAPPSDLTQCFFQKDGKAMETLLDGTDWEEAQEVPMS